MPGRRAGSRQESSEHWLDKQERKERNRGVLAGRVGGGGWGGTGLGVSSLQRAGEEGVQVVMAKNLKVITLRHNSNGEKKETGAFWSRQGGRRWMGGVQLRSQWFGVMTRFLPSPATNH